MSNTPNILRTSLDNHRYDTYQTTLVCESCFLVYAEMASLAFRTASRRALSDHKVSTKFSATQRTSAYDRPKLPEDAWRPMVGQDTRASMQEKMNAKIPERNSPEIPEPIRR